MKLSYRTRLFGVSLAVVVAVITAAGFYLEHELRTSTLSRIDQELEGYARTAVPLLENARAPSPAQLIESIDAIADRLGAATHTRVTVIDSSGQVLGDSELPVSELGAVDNHADRPEVQTALRDGLGLSRRYSTTVDEEMTYVAIPLERSDGRAVVRVARPHAEVTEAVKRLRVLLLGAGLAAILLAIALAALASHFMSRALRTLVRSARAITTGGDPRARLEVDAHGELGAVAGSLNQMSEEIQRTVSALAMERERFETVLEGMTDGVIALDGGSRVTLMNPAALRLLGLPEVPRERPLIEVVRSPALQKRLSEPEPDSSVEFDVPGKNVRRVMARVAPLRGGGSVLVLHDVTELRRLETVRRDFVANVSHELRTPMSIIRANAETLADGALGDEVHGPRLLEAIVRHSERLSALIGDLLDLSRLEAGRYRLKPSSIVIEKAVRRAVDGIERWIEIQIPSGLTVHADDKALDQVLVNLVDNAAKHTPEDADVLVRARAEGDVVRIEVRDTGPGIEPSLRSRVFERFYRVDPGRSREKGGTGLGLSIVKHLVESMGGKVGVEANEPKGSVFWVVLPAAVPT